MEIGALATGIMLSGGTGAVSANTEGVDNTKQVAPLAYYYNYEYGFPYEDVDGQNSYRTTSFYRHDGIFANSFYSEGKTWYLKGISQYNQDSSAYGHYEASK
ncbi:LCI fold-containing protein [Priestia taiwanensis]|uniref:LCI fold domain-containing protein n=1 Tax=Priestia taiwanensis TaxID=1347902 RepID=A0A917AMZ4_9BACI|nr:LCI fold-containing protein [Priestia taiwanensis]MBM7362446.1 hypothetical protein [Priestia taiwanensis]GGE62287.1 hypothetical protein GCM10007140_10700 [Priestia taiwanensis]